MPALKRITALRSTETLLDPRPEFLTNGRVLAVAAIGGLSRVAEP
jgi:hypothetical protein